MAHGFAAERTFGLEPYAERFAERGMAVFLFDYRNFGASDGEPRNLVHPIRHIQDWEAALAHVRGLEAVDAGRIGLWGSSFSGGHVIVTAARDGRISAVVSQVPFVDGLSTVTLLGMKFTARALVEGIKDVVAMILRRSPHYVPVVGDPNTFAVMNTPESRPGYLALVPEGSAWRNECPARILLMATLYRPIMWAEKVKCPALLVRAENDSLISPVAVERTAERMTRSTMISFSVGHFDVYFGDTFEQVVGLEADFLAKHLVANVI
jgi:pimeloyl-ACP methyl ester carboxylesterase